MIPCIRCHPSIIKTQKRSRQKGSSSWIVFQTEYWSALLSFSTILISHQNQTLSTLQGSHQGALQYVGNPLMHWHQLQANVSHQLCKVGVLCNSSAHAHTFCHWSCSVTSWFRPSFQQRRALLLVDTKENNSSRASDWLAHLPTLPFLHSHWLWAPHLVPLQLIMLQGKAM